MSPALDAAMATIVPTVSTAARAPGSVQPAAAKTEATPSSVTSVIPDVGCEDTPTIPTMRAATATKRTPKTPTPAAQTARWSGPRPPAKTPGTSAATSDHEYDAADHERRRAGLDRSVSSRPAATGLRSAPRAAAPRATPRNAPAIAGSPRSTVRIPAVATAPAPM